MPSSAARTNLARSNSMSAGLLLLRVVFGVVMMAHGWQKFTQTGIAGVTGLFRELGIPLADVLAPGLAVLELVGGALIILGLGTRIVGALLGIAMAGAVFTAHDLSLFFAQDGGYEFPLTLAAIGFAFALTGPGAWAVDSAFTRRRLN